MQFEKAYSFLLTKLEKELPQYLYYHNPSHTTDVIDASVKLAQAENITGEDLIILKTAALFHDAGFIETYTGHEDMSIKMAVKWLPQFDYNPTQIERITQLISVTRSSQKNFLRNYLKPDL